MLWFASKLLAGIFSSFSPSTHRRKARAEPVPYNILSAHSSFTTLVDDGASILSNNCLKTGHSSALKRARSDVTLCSFDEPGYIVASGANADTEHTLPRRKRRRTALDRTYTGSSSHHPPVYQTHSEHTHSCAPSSSRVTVFTKARCREDESAISPPTALQRTRNLSFPDSIPILPCVPAASLGAEGPCRRDTLSPGYNGTEDVPPSIPGKVGGRGVLSAFGEAPESAQMRAVAQNASVENSPTIHPASVLPCYPEPSSKAVALEGEVTRIEIAFEKFHQELLHSRDHDSLVQTVAQRVLASSRWLGVYNAYKDAASRALFGRGAGFRKNRFMDLMNLILEEAPRCGLDVPYTHQLHYGRYHYDGSEWSPEESSDSTSCDSETPEGESFENGSSGDGSSHSNSRNSKIPDGEPFRDDPMSPCIGTIEGSEQPVKSAWERAAVIVEVYNPHDKVSPRESKLISIDPDPCEETRASSPSPRRRVKGMPHHEHDPYPRMSWTELEQNFYFPRKFDTELFANATRIFRATGNRRHVVGVHAKRMKVRFCFYDRAGTIYTTPLDLRSDAQRFIAAIISLSFLDPFSLGLEPYLAANTPAAPSRLLRGGNNYSVEVDGLRLCTDSLLHAGEMFGRATAVFSAAIMSRESSNTALSALEMDVPPRVVLKMSWHTPSSHSEAEFLRLAEKRGVKGVARLYRSTTSHRVSEGLRSRLVPAPMYADRELRIQVIGPLARPLYEVDNLETFKAAFRSLVKTHHDLFEKAGILHRDISIGNLMVDASEPAQGVLIDLDFAVRVAQHGNPADGETFPPAGTLIFRAFDLLTPDNPLKAHYRHDLESFFYTLLWIQMHYVDGKKHVHPDANSFDFNFDGTWGSTRDRKVGFLLRSCYIDGYQLPLTSLRDQWLTPMHRMFGEALEARNSPTIFPGEGEGTALGQETFGGRITYEAFENVIRR